MSHKGSPAMVGAFVLGAILLGLGGIVLLGSKGLFRRTYPFVSYFEQSVNGLSEGAAVKFKGVKIGSVNEIRLPLRAGTDDAPVLVFFSIDAEKLRSSRNEELSFEELERAIDAGLRARLEQESFVTGLLYVSIAYVPDSETRRHESIDGIPEIPTAPSEFEEVAGQIRKFVDQISEVDLAAMVDDLHGTIKSLRELIESDRVHGVITSLDRTLVSVADTATSIKQEIGPLVESLRAAADRFRVVSDDVQKTAAESRRTLASIDNLVTTLDSSVETLTRSLEATLAKTDAMIDPSSPPLIRLDQTLSDLSAMSRAARAVLEILERDPSALVRGKGQSEQPR